MARRTSNIPDTMIHAEQMPWHNASNPIPDKATIKQMQKLAGMDFKVETAPYQFTDSQGRRHKTEQYRALYREDTGFLLDTVGPEYIPIQNDVAFGFVKKFVEAGDMRIETAGTFGNGRKCWLLANTGESFTVGRGKDRIESKLLFYIPHQYKAAIQILWTTVCVVCANTLAKALGTAEDRVRILHFQEYTQEIEEMALEKIGLAHDKMLAFKQEAQLLSSVPVEEEIAIELVGQVFTGKNVNKVITIFNGEGMGMNLPSRQGTAWGLLNAATEFVDHHIGQRTSDQSQRLERAWFGVGEREKRKMYENILEYAQSV